MPARRRTSVVFPTPSLVALNCIARRLDISTNELIRRAVLHAISLSSKEAEAVAVDPNANMNKRAAALAMMKQCRIVAKHLRPMRPRGRQYRKKGTIASIE